METAIVPHELSNANIEIQLLNRITVQQKASFKIKFTHRNDCSIVINWKIGKI